VVLASASWPPPTVQELVFEALTELEPLVALKEDGSEEYLTAKQAEGLRTGALELKAEATAILAAARAGGAAEPAAGAHPKAKFGGASVAAVGANAMAGEVGSVVHTLDNATVHIYMGPCCELR